MALLCARNVFYTITNRGGTAMRCRSKMAVDLRPREAVLPDVG
jgi:hypothetical protein